MSEDSVRPVYKILFVKPGSKDVVVESMHVTFHERDVITRMAPVQVWHELHGSEVVPVAPAVSRVSLPQATAVPIAPAVVPPAVSSAQAVVVPLPPPSQPVLMATSSPTV